MLGTVTSVNGVSIRLTEERWQHITSQHPELAHEQGLILEVVEQPERVLAGEHGQLFAVRTLSDKKWLLVVYRELEAEGVILDGFIVTAFFNSKIGRAHV